MRPVFIHISKNAGTSIVSSAGDRIVNAGHRTAASWVAEHGSEAPLFSAVRHPYDRVLSEYHYRRRRWEGGENNPHLTNLSLPFDEWVIATYEGDMVSSRTAVRATSTAPAHSSNSPVLPTTRTTWSTTWRSGSSPRLIGSAIPINDSSSMTCCVSNTWQTTGRR